MEFEFYYEKYEKLCDMFGLNKISKDEAIKFLDFDEIVRYMCKSFGVNFYSLETTKLSAE